MIHLGTSTELVSNGPANRLPKATAPARPRAASSPALTPRAVSAPAVQAPPRPPPQYHQCSRTKNRRPTQPMQIRQNQQAASLQTILFGKLVFHPAVEMVDSENW